MTEHRNLRLMKNALEAFQSGDRATLTELLAEDVLWHLPGRSFLAGDYRGHEEVLGFFRRLMEETAGTFRVESVDMMANDSGGVFVHSVHAKRREKALDASLLLRVSIRNGKITEGRDHIFQEHEFDEFWS